MNTNAFEADVASFARYLAFRNRAATTQRIYCGAARKLGAYAARQGLSGWHDVDRATVQGFIAEVLTEATPGYASNLFRALQQFFKWWADEEDAPNPMAGMSGPQVPEKPVEVLREDKVKALLRACQGKDFLSRRDTALVYLLIDSGLRLNEISALTVADVDLNHREVTVLGEGRRPRVVPFGRRAAYALDRYLSARARHRWADREELWLAERGRGGRVLSDSGIYQMLRRRGEEIGVPELHPHMLRHSWAHYARQDDRLRDDEIMNLAGWRSRQMLSRYAASTAAERAREAGKRHSLGDRL